MKRLNIVLLLIVISLLALTPSFTHVTAQQTSYSLDWKLEDGEVLAYATSMNAAETSNTLISFDFGQLLTEGDLPEELTQQLAALTLPQSGSLISLLEQNERGNISVRMIFHEVSLSENGLPLDETFNELMQDMIGTVALRGELTPDGRIASFYLNESQENLLTVFFELPTQNVQVGDEWSVNFNCISMGNGFIADKANRVNRVVFSEVSQTSDGQLVAVLDYVLVEEVEGSFLSPLNNEALPSTMNCSFIGQGRFLIDAGRWEVFKGEMAINSTGIMSSNAVQQFALIPLEDIPEEYLTLE